jgi:glucoamylase
MSDRARVETLFWPTVDRGSHIGELRLGIERDGKLFWLDEEAEAQQSYLQDTNVLLTRLGAVEVVDLVHELEPVLVRRVSGEGRLVVQCRPELDGSTRLIGASVEANRVVFYRRDVALAIGALGAEAFSHGFGNAEGGIACTIAGHAVVALAFGASSREAVARLDAALQQDFTKLLASRRRHDAARLDSAAPPPVSAPEGLVPLYRRTLLVLDLLSDRRTGAVIAAPEVDPDFEHSGG